MKLKILLLTVLLSLGLAISYPALADESTQAKEDYLNKVYAKFKSEWRIIKAKDGWTCEVYILQDRDGNVLKSNVSKCNTDDKRFIRQTEKAVKLASPYPRASDTAFTSELILNPTIKGDVNFFKELTRRAAAGDPEAVKVAKVIADAIELEAKKGKPLYIELFEKKKQYDKGMVAWNSGQYKIAFDKWLPLAEGGRKTAQSNLGKMYLEGKGVERDFKKSFYWYKKATNSGLSGPEYNVARMYHKGIGVEQNIDKAVYWYKKAAKLENKQAREVLDEFNLNYDN